VWRYSKNERNNNNNVSTAIELLRFFFLFSRFFLYLFEDPLLRVSSDPFPNLNIHEFYVFYQLVNFIARLNLILFIFDDLCEFSNFK
jgi:hypothetical protein